MSPAALFIGGAGSLGGLTLVTVLLYGWLL